MPPAAKSKVGSYTREAMARKVEAKAAHQKQLDKAVALVAAGKGGAMVVADMVEGCTRSQIRTAVIKSKVLEQGKPWRAQWAIMTPIEMERLVKWVIASADNDNPATEREVSEQVTKMLQCRRLANRSKHDGKHNVELTPAEKRLALEGGELSHMWFMGFYAANPSKRRRRSRSWSSSIATTSSAPRPAYAAWSHAPWRA